MKKIFFGLILLMLIVPFVNADTIMPGLPTFLPHLLLGCLIVEIIIAYFLFNKKIKFWKISLIILLANIVSYIFGLLMPIFFGEVIGSIIYEAIGLYHGVVNFSFIGIFILFLLTSFIEWGVIYLFIRKNIKKPIKNSFLVSLIINLASYILIILYYYLTSEIIYFSLLP